MLRLKIAFNISKISAYKILKEISPYISIMSANCYFCKISIEKYGFEKCMKILNEEVDTDYSLSRTKSAAQLGHLECLKKVHKEENESLEGICNIAAANGNLQ